MTIRALESPLQAVGTITPLDVNVLNTVNTEFPGPQRFVEGTLTSTPNTAQSLITGAAPALGLTWKLRRIEVVSRGYSTFNLKLNGGIVKTGYTSPAESTVSLPIEPWVEMLPTDTIDLTYEQIDGPAIPVTGRIYYTEHVAP